MHKCIDHDRQLTWAKHSSTKLERRHHLATDHGPMVQGKLLTMHHGGKHGDREAAGGQPSLRQGAGTGSSGDPEIESRRRWNGNGFFLAEFSLGFFEAWAKYMPKESLRGGPLGPGG